MSEERHDRGRQRNRQVRNIGERGRRRITDDQVSEDPAPELAPVVEPVVDLVVDLLGGLLG